MHATGEPPGFDTFFRKSRKADARKITDSRREDAKVNFRRKTSSKHAQSQRSLCISTEEARRSIEGDPHLLKGYRLEIVKRDAPRSQLRLAPLRD
jgi:hypothetical protein